MLHDTLLVILGIGYLLEILAIRLAIGEPRGNLDTDDWLLAASKMPLCEVRLSQTYAV